MGWCGFQAAMHPGWTAMLFVALRSEYTRYSSLARLVSRAPRPFRPSRHPTHGSLDNHPQSVVGPLEGQVRRAQDVVAGVHQQDPPGGDPGRGCL